MSVGGPLLFGWGRLMKASEIFWRLANLDLARLAGSAGLNWDFSCVWRSARTCLCNSMPAPCDFHPCLITQVKDAIFPSHVNVRGRRQPVGSSYIVCIWQSLLDYKMPTCYVYHFVKSYFSTGRQRQSNRWQICPFCPSAWVLSSFIVKNSCGVWHNRVKA